MSVTSGESFANTGTSDRVARRTACITSAAVRGSHANTWPLSSTFGHEMLTSIIETPRASRSRIASFAYSSTVLPAIDTTTRAPCSTNHGKSRSMNASIPEPCKPDRVQHAAGSLGHARSWPARARVHHDGFRHDAAEGRNVEELREFLSGSRTPGRRQHRIRQREPAKSRRHVDGARSLLHRLGRPHGQCHRVTLCRGGRLRSNRLTAPRRRRPESFRHRRNARGHRGRPDLRRMTEPCVSPRRRR